MGAFVSLRTAIAGPLNAKQQKRWWKRQYRQMCGHHRRLIMKKPNEVRFTFPISYSCPIEYRTNPPSSTPTNQSKSGVSISFTDDQSVGHRSLLSVASRSLARSANASCLCRSQCGSTLTNGVCTRLVQRGKHADVLAELHGMFENLTSNNRIT